MKKAFTLAEVLITLGIIGIIAALTMPALMASYQKKATATQLAKMYTVLNQANRAAFLEHEEIAAAQKEFTKAQMAEHYDKYLFSYMKVAKVCTEASDCLPQKGYTSLSGVAHYISTYPHMVIAATLQDGSSILIWANTNNTTALFVDVNGIKGPNVLGKDLFRGTYGNSGFSLIGSTVDRDTLLNDSTSYNGCTPENTGYYAGDGCGGLIQQDGWDIKDDYPW